MAQSGLPPRIMERFVATLSEEISPHTLSAILSKADLPKEWAYSAKLPSLDAGQSAQTFSQLQAAFRTYYGRGARGVLMRIGAKLWHSLLTDSSLEVKARAALIRRIPTSLRIKPALELLARLLSVAPGTITVHTLDLDLLLVDRASSTALSQSAPSPVCFVTLGLIRECLHWADGKAHDVEERACQAMGASQCEFKIITGG